LLGGRGPQSDKSRRLPSLGSEIMCSTNLYDQDQSDLTCLQYLETGRALLQANLVPQALRRGFIIPLSILERWFNVNATK
jgi:hypothetical protein